MEIAYLSRLGAANICRQTRKTLGSLTKGTMQGRDEAAPIRRAIIRAWFSLDAVVALAPPLYWAADGATMPILGLPGALFYFLSVSACIAASLVAAYILDGPYRGVTP